ncbi:MAG TPA: HEAT repeat domain-containing protein, partial [Candidatus Eremiobacteraeota bacterium]|nr:HEAT repeat domain-containing protein [Candidatus Eremiobacteraeota bacterium]
MVEEYKLIRDLTSKDEYVRLSAARTLGNQKTKEAVDGLIQLLNDTNVAVRTIAAEALGKIGDDRAANGLITGLSDEYSRMRKASAEALGKLNDYRALTPLINLYQKDPDPDVRDVARKSIEKINILVNDILDKLEEELDSPKDADRKQAVRFLGKIGNGRAITILLKAQNDKNWEIQQSASEEIDRLLIIGIEPFLNGLKDKNWKIRVAAADYLGRIRNLASIDPLVEALQDEKKEVVRSTCKALGEIKEKRILYPLRSLLQNTTDNKTKEEILTAISKIGGTESIEFMLKILRENMDFTRDIAEERLFDMGTEVLLPIALEMQEMNIKAQEGAVRILIRFGEKGVNYFVEKLNDPDKQIRKACVNALGHIQAREALHIIQYYAKDSDEEMREIAINAIKLINKKKKRTLKPSYVFSGSIIDRVSTFFSSTIKMIHNVRTYSKNEETFICGKCGQIISRKASSGSLTGLLEKSRFGKCPQCNKILCNNCADAV